MGEGVTELSLINLNSASNHSKNVLLTSSSPMTIRTQNSSG